MPIFFGWRVRSAVLARLTMICRFCSNPAAQTVVQRRRWFTLFFVPVIPLGGPYLMQCAYCGQTSKLEKAQALEVVAQAQQAGVAGPQAGAVAPPAVGPAREQIPPAQAS